MASFSFKKPVDGYSTELVYKNKSFTGFVIIDHVSGSMARNNQVVIRKLIGVADCLPPIDSKLVFRTCLNNLLHYLNTNASKLMTATGIMLGPVKFIIRDLGLAAVCCSAAKIKLDLTLDGIYVADAEFPRVKAIAIASNIKEDWKSNLASFYRKISETYFPKDKEFIQFINRLSITQDDGKKIEDVFLSSSFFWSKFRRISIISEVGDLVDDKPGSFATVNCSENILNWRARFLQDPKLSALVRHNAPPNNLDIQTFLYKSKEIDILLKFVRGTIVHFTTMCTSLRKDFPKRLDLLDYYEEKFPDIMKSIYKVSEAVEKHGRFSSNA